MSAAKRVLSAYDGRRLIGRVEITPRRKRAAPTVKAIDAAGKRLGIFKSQKAALRAIDVALSRKHRAFADG